MNDDAASSFRLQHFVFYANFERKILLCIFSYYYTVLTKQWVYRFDKYALLSNWILFFLVLTLQTILPYIEFVLTCAIQTF